MKTVSLSIEIKKNAINIKPYVNKSGVVKGKRGSKRSRKFSSFKGEKKKG